MGTFNATTTSEQKVGEIEILDKLKEATICWSTQCVLHTMCFTSNVFYKHNVLYAQCVLHISWLSAEIGMKVRIVFESFSFFVLLQFSSSYPHPSPVISLSSSSTPTRWGMVEPVYREWGSFSSFGKNLIFYATVPPRPTNSNFTANNICKYSAAL